MGEIARFVGMPVARSKPVAAEVCATDALLSGFPPVLPRHAHTLLLGSFPGEASLAQSQYYAHPRNQFWRLLGTCLEVDLAALPYEQRLEETARRGVGVWDVVAQCKRAGSLDSAVTQASVNPLADYLREHAPHLARIGFNGSLSWKLGRHLADFGYAVYKLPSSSPAAAMYTFEQKLVQWRVLFDQAGSTS